MNTNKLNEAAPALLDALTDVIGAIKKARTMRAPAGHYDEDVYYNGIDFAPQVDIAEEILREIKKEPAKLYSIRYGVGRAKYVVNFHDGQKTHRDGSPFYDIEIFSNKKKMDAFLRELKGAGYIQK